MERRAKEISTEQVTTGRMERSNDALRDEWMGGEGISGLGDEEGIPPMNLIGQRELEGIGQI